MIHIKNKVSTFENKHLNQIVILFLYSLEEYIRPLSLVGFPQNYFLAH